MCMTNAELLSTSNENLLKFYKRAVELQEGKSPYDINQLLTEILRRINKNPLENPKVK